MIGALGGVGAALLWGCQNALNSRASRAVTPLTALFVTLLVGLVTALPFALVAGWPSDASAADWGWAALAAGCAVVGLGCLFAALRRAPITIVLPIASAQGAAATVFAVLGGERLTAFQVAALTLVVVGVILVARATGSRTGPCGAVGVPIGFATATALVIGLELFALGEAEDGLGPAWEIVVLRGGGLLVIVLVFLARAVRPHAPARARRQLMLAGVLENLGFASYIVGTGAGGVAVPAVLASQFSVVGAIIGVVAFGERLTRGQLTGIGAIVVGVAGTIVATS